MYLCSICGACSKPGQPRKVWVIERHVPCTVVDRSGYEIETTRTEIEKELPVCHDCFQDLKNGVTLEDMKLMHKTKPGPTRLDEWPEETTMRVK